MAQLDSVAQECNYTGYMDKYVKYPPQGLLPLPGTSTTYEDGCDVWTMVLNASLIVNPGFNYYRIFDNVRPSPLSPRYSVTTVNPPPFLDPAVADPLGRPRLPYGRFLPPAVARLL